MNETHHLEHEQRRLEFLRSLNILDTAPEEEFDRITGFAASLCAMPFAAITLVDEKRQWFKSAIGLEVRQTERTIAFCDHTIRSTQPFVIHDASIHPDFEENPLVTASPGLRFYAGFPLRSRQGFNVGALAVMDTVPRTLDEVRIKTLTMLAEQVIVLLELRQQRTAQLRIAAERDWIHAELTRYTRHLKQAQSIAKIGSWELDARSRQFICTEEVYAILHMSQRQARKGETLDNFLRYVQVSDRLRLSHALEEALRAEKPLDIEHRMLTANGKLIIVRQRAKLMQSEEGRLILAGTLQDITRERQAREQFRLLHTCISRLHETVMITEAALLDEPGPRIVFVNDAFEALTGYKCAEIIGKSPRLLQGPATSRVECDRIRLALQNHEPITAELINYGKDGRQYWLDMTITPVIDEAGTVTHFVSIQRDITQIKAAEESIERLAFYDPLTKLPNRRLLLDRMHLAVESVRRTDMICALLFIDLDNFKTLNDTLGHEKGDRLLEHVARRLEGCVRKSSTVARLGGDEFVIMLEDLGTEPIVAAARAEVIIQKILLVFNQKFQLADVEYHCTPSIGAALFDKDFHNIDDLFKRADLAMYQAKAMGRNTACFFDPEMQTAIDNRVGLERDLRAALQQQQFILHYQPQVDRAGNTVGAEALIRWQHPRHGLMQPPSFIRLVEETGLILRLGQWVLETACKQLVSWAAQPGKQHASVSVNISAAQFSHPDFVKLVMRAIESTGACPTRLKLELTESMLVKNPEDTIAKMAQLRMSGVGFSLDDFGTGYSSLSYLKRLPLHQIKIDQSFVKDVLTDIKDAAIVRTILALGQTLNIEVIAEGVESREQRDFLAHLGCYLYQGYFFSEPLPADHL